MAVLLSILTQTSYCYVNALLMQMQKILQQSALFRNSE